MWSRSRFEFRAEGSKTSFSAHPCGPEFVPSLWALKCAEKAEAPLLGFIFSAHFGAHNLGTNSGPHGCAENEVFDPSALNSKRYRYHIEPRADLGSCVLLHQVTLYEVMIGRHAFYFDSCGEKAARDHIEPHANSCFFVDFLRRLCMT